MRGRKPNLQLVTPVTSDAGPTPEQEREVMISEAVRRMRPRGIDREVMREWNRVARMLADPTVDRLKPRFVDVIAEYCRATVRLRRLRAYFEELVEKAAMVAIEKPTEKVGPTSAIEAEIHTTEGRHGEQLKSHPLVAQINETWRQWRSMVAMLGLSPADERNLIPGQGDLFDESERYFA